MKKTKIFLMLAIIVSTLALSGCTGYNDIMFSSYESNGKYYTQAYKTSNGEAIYVKKSNNNYYYVNLDVGTNYKDYNCYKVSVNNKIYIGIGKVTEKLRITLFNDNLNTPGVNTVSVEVYENGAQVNGERKCSGASKSLTLPKMAISDDALSNASYISVTNIISYLNANGMRYYDTVNGVPRACSSYGLSDTDANVPACLALSQSGRVSSNCASFVKEIIKIFKGVAPNVSIYEYGSIVKNSDGNNNRNNKNGDISGLSTNKTYILAQYGLTGSQKHISFVYYNDNEKKWHSVGGNMSGYVRDETLLYVLKNADIDYSYYQFKSF